MNLKKLCKEERLTSRASCPTFAYPGLGKDAHRHHHLSVDWTPCTVVAVETQLEISLLANSLFLATCGFLVYRPWFGF